MIKWCFKSSFNRQLYPRAEHLTSFTCLNSGTILLFIKLLHTITENLLLIQQICLIIVLILLIIFKDMQTLQCKHF